ncbi:putative thioesterase PNKD isoform X2 [Lampetra fluviatilis]
MARAERPLLFTLAYTLYTKTKLGYVYHKRQLKQAREHFPGGHSTVKPVIYHGLMISPVPIMTDNYGYMVTDLESRTAVVLDASDPQAIEVCIEQEGVTLEAILATHKHCGGNQVLKKIYKCPVYGCPHDNIPGLTNGINCMDCSPVADGEELRFGRLCFRARFTPGHTVGHMVYVLDGQPFGAPDCLFSGDLLFLAGCGRMFEGTPETMLSSLDIVSSLADSTLLFPGHECALDNLSFAVEMEPDNPAILLKLDWVAQQRREKLSTCPSSIGEEKQYNPFLRTRSTALQAVLGLVQPAGTEESAFHAHVLEDLRHRKDSFKGKS